MIRWLHRWWRRAKKVPVMSARWRQWQESHGWDGPSEKGLR